jgi:lysophospholipase L1-like esterase
MTDVAGAPTVSPDALLAAFSPDFVRRFIAEPILPPLLRKMMGPGQRMRASQFAQFPPPDGHVVLLGDSITELGLWHEWFAGTPVLNRGIGGETSADLLRRLDTAIGHPAAVFLLIGTNDLTLGVPLREIVENVRTLLAEVERRAPGTPVIVQSVMPRTPRYREDLLLLNRAYQALVDQSGPSVEYLDLWPALADERGDLTKAYSEERLHLNGAGYAAWVDVLRPQVERILTRAEHLSA